MTTMSTLPRREITKYLQKSLKKSDITYGMIVLMLDYHKNG